MRNASKRLCACVAGAVGRIHGADTMAGIQVLDL